MKYSIYLFVFITSFGYSQKKVPEQLKPIQENKYLSTVDLLTQDAAFELMKRANQEAQRLSKNVSIAILDHSGTLVLLVKGDGVGPHNTEAARRKAYTALSTKTSTLMLLRNAESNNDTKNLNTLPELLLLSGGVPLWHNGIVIGSIGVAGGGSPENDDAIAKSASIPEFGIQPSN
ncbi:heme-binding protein [Flavobacterium azooxidireducens]|uniref:Heme-binding protein n=1 Tax=Flavobacterium azooxidireducens TaxID=1871076 RepID=A0ABY4KH20_9FLAO|nr:heme-binding protein [Flavobacterium azooxidireducens]UPQ80121.1 heme-binding protein [Flavobacterium azooxidireducens]